jgi:hypothetical protein
MPPKAKAPQDSPYKTKDEIAVYLRRSPRSIDRDPTIPRIKLGNRVLFHLPTVEATLLARQA